MSNHVHLVGASPMNLDRSRARFNLQIHMSIDLKSAFELPADCAECWYRGQNQACGRDCNRGSGTKSPHDFPLGTWPNRSRKTGTETGPVPQTPGDEPGTHESLLQYDLIAFLQPVEDFGFGAIRNTNVDCNLALPVFTLGIGD